MQHYRSGSHHFLVANGLAEGGPVGGIVDALVEHSALAEGQCLAVKLEAASVVGCRRDDTVYMALYSIVLYSPGSVMLSLISTSLEQRSAKG